VTARRDLVPFAVTLIAAAGFVLTVARWSRPTTRRDAVAAAPTTSHPSPEPLAQQRPGSVVVVTGTPLRAPPSPPRVPSPAGAAASDAGGAAPVGLAAARAQLDALRARLDAIDVDAGGSAAVTARRVLATATAPVIYETLGESSEGFEGRYEAYRASVLDGGATPAARAQHLRPEDSAHAALLDELGALLRPAP
jgi:hypothetical protein